MNRQRRKRLTEAFEKVAEAMEILEEVKRKRAMITFQITSETETEARRCRITLRCWMKHTGTWMMPIL